MTKRKTFTIILSLLLATALLLSLVACDADSLREAIFGKDIEANTTDNGAGKKNDKEVTNDNNQQDGTDEFCEDCNKETTACVCTVLPPDAPSEMDLLIQSLSDGAMYSFHSSFPIPYEYRAGGWEILNWGNKPVPHFYQSFVDNAEMGEYLFDSNYISVVYDGFTAIIVVDNPCFAPIASFQWHVLGVPIYSASYQCEEYAVDVSITNNRFLEGVPYSTLISVGFAFLDFDMSGFDSPPTEVYFFIFEHSA
ncbi:MAG: hypothetical protein FWD49_07595 [Firmicutes bacterium]|nr:hypothetical protein [Bacillota bacterium]